MSGFRRPDNVHPAYFETVNAGRKVQRPPVQKCGAWGAVYRGRGRFGCGAAGPLPGRRPGRARLSPPAGRTPPMGGAFFGCFPRPPARVSRTVSSSPPCSRRRRLPAARRQEAG
jgi:hypothetical protein